MTQLTLSFETALLPPVVTNSAGTDSVASEFRSAPTLGSESPSNRHLDRPLPAAGEPQRLGDLARVVLMQYELAVRGRQLMAKRRAKMLKANSQQTELESPSIAS